MAWSTKYTIEFWDKHGNQLMDFSGKATNRSITQSRNRPDDISFNLDLADFEKYCRDQFVDPRQILIVNSTEVRVRRLGKYVAGGQLVYKRTSLSGTGAVIECRVKGFLWLFSKRYTGETASGLVSEVHTAAEGSAKSRTDLAWYLINASQSLTNGDFGVTRGLTGGSTTLYDKTYARTNIMDALIALTELQTDPIDIWFSYDKVFNTAAHQGSDRPDVVFEYPSANIISLDVPDDGSDITNEVIGIGSGGADGTQARYDADDLISQSNYQLRQDILNTNATDNSDNGLTDAAEAKLASVSTPITIPALTVNGNVPPYFTDYDIGDRITVKTNGHVLIEDIIGTYRLEKRTLTLDDSDNETVTLEVSAI